MSDIIDSLRAAISQQDGAKVFHLANELVMQYDSGLIKVLPCKVGTTVYVIAKCESVHVLRDDDYFTGTGAMECPFEDQCNFEDCDDANEQIIETTITGLWCGKQVEMFLEHLEITVMEKDFGKSVFLSRAEAEKALESEKK